MHARARTRPAVAGLAVATAAIAGTLASAAAPAALAAMPPASAARATPQPQAKTTVAQLDERCASPLYPECRRLRYTYGPLTVTPGANAQLVGQMVGKPAYDGYAIRMDANMVRASDGTVPPVDVVHLHHAVWLAIPQYGNFLPFYGVGEEKTVASSPPGYGMLVRAGDVWLLNHMLHNLTTVTETVLITYDIDYVPREAAERRGIKRVLPLWIDVRYDTNPYYPVFNVQRGFGTVNPKTGKRECTYPRDRCAAFDPYGDPQPGNGKGYDWRIPEQFAGTLVGAGGHVHPGGLRDEVSIVRTIGGEERVRRIFTSEAVYYDPGGPVSWDVSMTVTPKDWRVKVRPGDRIRLNAVYDAEHGSWYEGMGIVMAWVAPGEESGVDPFQKVRRKVKVKRRKARARRGRRRARRPRYRYVERYVPIETRGQVTHGHLAENDNHGGTRVRPLPAREGPLVSEIGIANFAYYPGDLSRAGDEGIPRVKADRTLRFSNADSSAGIWHTVTTCRQPCTGTTGISYPLADALPPLDSLELGYGYPDRVQPAAQRHAYSLKPRESGLRPGETYTYFCRIHPFMRGAFKVVE